MTISSSLNASVAGLNANATKLATISDNIANSGTYGYKRVNADFASMVIGQGAGGYSAGGVRADTVRLVEERGALISTSNSTDIAISGRGMLPVADVASIGAPLSEQPLMLTTTGSFHPDANGMLRTESGLVLLGWPANSDGTIPNYARDSVSGLEPIQINPNQTSGDPTTEMSLGVNLPAAETVAGASGTALPLSVEYFGNLGTSETLNFSFTPNVPGTGASNEWTMTVTDSAQNGALVGEYILTFDDSRANGGALLNVTTVSGGAYNPVEGTVDITAAGGPISIGIGAIGETDGLIQLSASFSPTSITKNGSPVGNLVGVEVNENGMLVAAYDTGFTQVLYQIPVVDVPNLNGLVSLNDQAFQVSPESGSFFLWDAGDGPAGGMNGYAREGSATDVAAELTALIQTQRAYSSNAKVIQTVDEMLQETTNIKR